MCIDCRLDLNRVRLDRDFVSNLFVVLPKVGNRTSTFWSSIFMFLNRYTPVTFCGSPHLLQSDDRDIVVERLM